MTRLMGQSPAGLSATGESDTRNTYDMIAARQELELRPELERLDRVIAASEGIDPGALTFAFRPLWQLDAATAATIALQKAQATQVYAGLKLWPAATTARLVEAQLAEDGTYPNARAVFGEGGAADPISASPTLDFDPDQPRDGHGRWTAGLAAEPLPSATTAVTHATSVATPPPRSKRSTPTASGGILSFLNALNPIGTAQAQEMDPEEESRRPGEPGELEPGDVILIQRFNAALQALREVDPDNQNLRRLEPPGYVPTPEAVERIEAATRAARNARADPAPPPDPNPNRLPELHLPLEAPDFTRHAIYPEIEPGPPGVVIQVSGRTAQQRGLSYQAGIVARFGLMSPSEDWEDAGLKPDGLDDGLVGEAKYTDHFAGSIYNPDLNLPFKHGEVERTKQQALKYHNFAPDETLTYYVNDQDFAEYLVRTFRSAAISHFRVIIVPATRG